MDDSATDSSTSKSSASPDAQVPSSKITAVARVQRNVAEKLRRDKLNGYISELATIVPIVSKAAKRMDKTSILRLSAAYLRICKSPLSGRKKLKSFKWCPNFLNPDQVRGILESVDGFLLVTETNGKILFTSRSVERYLGFQDVDVVGHTLYMFIHPEDVEIVKSELNQLLSSFSNKGNSAYVPRCSFHCRMKEKGQPRSEVQTYQFVHVMGAMTLVEEEDSSENSSKKTITTFKAFIRIVDPDPYNQLSLEEATADEYVTRHSLDGTIIFTDHRISTITGHLPHEVTGQNAYMYIHSDDISVTLFAHHLMFSSDKGSGMIVYRLRTRDDKYVYLKTVGCLQYDRSTSQVDHFVCVNQQLSEHEGKAELKYFTGHFIPHIKGSTASSLFESVKALQKSYSKPSTSQNINANPAAATNKSIKLLQGGLISGDLKLEGASNNVISEYNLDVSEVSNLLKDDAGSPLVNYESSTFTIENSLLHSKSKDLTCKDEVSDSNSENKVTSSTTTLLSETLTANIQDTIIPSHSYQRSHITNLQSQNNNLTKLSDNITPIYVNDSDFSILSPEPKPTYLPKTPDQNTGLPMNITQFQNIDLAQTFNMVKGKEQRELILTGDSNESSSISFCSNTKLVSDFYDVSNMNAESSNFVLNSLEISELDSNLQPFSAKLNPVNNFQSSIIDSDDSQTIPLLSPMCPLKVDLNLGIPANRGDNPISSQSDFNAPFRQRTAKTDSSFIMDSSILSSSALLHHNADSIPSNECGGFYQQSSEHLNSLDD